MDMDEVMQLDEIVYDERARSGEWCNHGEACMNFPACPSKPTFREIESKIGPFKWYAVLEEFDIVAQETAMSAKHPYWSLKMCRNPRYWQKGVRRRLLDKAEKFKVSLKKQLTDAVIILEIPECHGIDVIRTMAKVGVRFEWGLGAKRFVKVMLVGKKI